MNKKKTFLFLRLILVTSLVSCLFTNMAMAQGVRYAEPVFDEVTVSTNIPFSSVIKEGETTPTTLYLDFYEPQGDTLSARPLVITVFGGAFVAGGRDFVDMQAYCTRLAKHGYAAASIDYRLLSFWNLNATSLVRTAYMASQDVSSAIRFLKFHGEEYRIDTSQVFLLGNSAGSIAIMCELFMDESERPAETFQDPDLGSMHSSGYEEYAGFSPAVTGAVPHWGGVDALGVISKEEYVPLCLIHGTDDTTVPYDSGYCYNGILPNVMPFMYGSNAIVGRLNELGISDFGFHPFEGEGHAFYLTSVLSTLIEEKFNACFEITRDFLYHHLKSPTSVSESKEQLIQVYPNPATHSFTVEGSGKMVVTNTLGQPALIMEIDGKEIVELPQGLYFVKLGGATRKVMVE